MIDLHSHLLPGVDDGATNLAQSLEMARIAVAEGIRIQACTPHITPGVYDNTGPAIRRAVEELQARLDLEGIPLTLVEGADNHVAPQLIDRLASGAALTIYDSRYVLIEPPQHVLPPRIEDAFFELIAAGYVPILTHPERMTWIERDFHVIHRLFSGGVWMQLTAGSLLGDFGARPTYWAERMLGEGLIHIVATDAHGVDRRPPMLRRAFDVLCQRAGGAEAENMLMHRPMAVLENADPHETLAGPVPRKPSETSISRRLAELWLRK